MESQLTHALTQLRDAQGNRNRVAVLGGQGYLVFSTTSSTDTICVQATANRRLPKGVKLTPEQAGALGELGLRQTRASDDFQRQVARDDHDTIADLVARTSATMTAAYGAQPGETTVKTRFETVPELDNQHLDEAMNHLPKTEPGPLVRGFT